MKRKRATLHGQYKEKIYKSSSHSTNSTQKKKKKNAEQIGDKCSIQGKHNQRVASVLLNTGAQVSIISEDYVKLNLIDAEI